jgi:hypothetical protein
LGTAREKAEFVKDVIGLANTKPSGRRWMIIGFDDKARKYYGPPPSSSSIHVAFTVPNPATPGWSSSARPEC